MERHAYELLSEMEQTWWYRGRAAIVQALLARKEPPVSGTVLDFGAGYGGMHDTLARHGTVSAYEPDDTSRAVAAKRGYARVYGALDEALAEPYNLIALCDVLEHIEDDRAFLARAKQSLTPDGVLLLTVPAVPFLWSSHDTTHHHYRRYTRASLAAVLKENGFEVLSMSYWNFFLFPAAALARLLGKGGEDGLRLPRLLDALFFMPVRVEAFLLRFFPLPIGVSLVVLACPAHLDRAPVVPGSRAAVMNRVTQHRERTYLFMRYIISGATGGVIQTAGLYFWVSVLGLRGAYLWGVVIAYLIALAVTFGLQKYWTFRDRERSVFARQAFWYTIISLGNLGLNTLILYVGKIGLEAVGLDFFHGWYLLVQVFAVGVAAAASFLANYHVTFRATPSQVRGGG